MSYFTTEVLEAYKIDYAYKRQSDNSIYKNYKLKCSNKIKSTISKNFYIIFSAVDDTINELYILNKELKHIKLKIGKILIK